MPASSARSAARRPGPTEREAARKGVGDVELARLHAPVGIAIGARTPDEVAVSIAAQLIEANVAVRRRRIETISRATVSWPDNHGMPRTVLVAIVLALFAVPSALAGRLAPFGALAPLPSVSPPAPLPGGMHWARQKRARPASAGEFRAGQAAVGVAAGVNGSRLAAGLGLGSRRLAAEAPPRPGRRDRPPRWPRLAGSADPRIRYVEPVEPAQVAHVRNDPLTYEVDPATGAPYEWQFHAVGLDQALNLAKGDPSILVGVIDTGIDPVPDLKGKIAETFWDPSATKSGIDAYGHGTFVASIIAARNDDGFGLAGFCGACRLAIYKASPLTNVQVAEGIRTLTDAHVRVINLSIVLDAPPRRSPTRSTTPPRPACSSWRPPGTRAPRRSTTRRRPSRRPAARPGPAWRSAPPTTPVGGQPSRTAGSSCRCSRRAPSTPGARPASSARSPPPRPTSATWARARPSSATSAERATPSRAGRASRCRRSQARLRSCGRSSRR